MKWFIAILIAVVLAASVGYASEKTPIIEPIQLIEKTLLPALRSKIIQDSKTWFLQGQHSIKSKNQLAAPVNSTVKSPA